MTYSQFGRSGEEKICCFPRLASNLGRSIQLSSHYTEHTIPASLLCFGATSEIRIHNYIVPGYINLLASELFFKF